MAVSMAGFRGLVVGGACCLLRFVAFFKEQGMKNIDFDLYNSVQVGKIFVIMKVCST